MSSDRVYVAAEMHAFLLAWLTQLPCPVLNRPTVNSLAGPAWRQERWVTIAAGLGVPIFPFSRRITIQNSRSAQELNASSHKLVTVVGKQCLGSSNSLLTDWAFALANAAKADALSMEFIGTGRDLQFVSATPFLDIANEQVALAMSNYFGVIED